jgi:DNA-directed RNA polymerase subunit RPC12/RpoP
MNNEISYFCYRCGEENKLDLPMPNAPQYHHTNLTCKKCGDGTYILVSHCPSCSRYVYWIDDMCIPDLVVGFARYMVHNMQALIDKAAVKGASVSIDTPSTYPINADCPCGEKLSIEIPIPDLD